MEAPAFRAPDWIGIRRGAPFDIHPDELVSAVLADIFSYVSYHISNFFRVISRIFPLSP